MKGITSASYGEGRGFPDNKGKRVLITMDNNKTIPAVFLGYHGSYMVAEIDGKSEEIPISDISVTRLRPMVFSSIHL